jgi:Protein of unknown function (DUF3341)
VTRVVAIFESPEAIARAIETSRHAGWRAVSVCAPAFDATLLELVGATHSPVADWALAGGVLGAISGFALTIGTVRQWPGLIVSGKPLVSVPSFLIVVFELTILFAAIAAVTSFLFASRRARRVAGAACNADTTDARFALVVEVPGSFADAGPTLSSLGAVECRPL